MSNRIKELRVKANLTVRELSESTKIDYSYLSKLEKGQKNLTNEMSLRLATFFSVDKNFIEDKEHYSITCYTNDLKQCVLLYSSEMKYYGNCYTSKLYKKDKVINILNKEVEPKILKDKKEMKRLIDKIWKEKEMIDSMDEWTTTSLLIAKEKIEKLLENNKKR